MENLKQQTNLIFFENLRHIMSVATCADLSDKEAKDRISSIMTANITVTPSFNRSKSYKNIEDLVEEKQISMHTLSFDSSEWRRAYVGYILQRKQQR